MELNEKLEKAIGYFEDRENPESLKIAADMFGELVDEGYEPAYYWLGYARFYGDGIEQDYDKAAELFDLSASTEGNVGAVCFLGICYYDGLGVEEDRSEAYTYLCLASDYGDEDAQDLLKKLEFKSEDKKAFEEQYKDTEISEEELADILERAENGSGLSQYLAAKYYEKSEQLDRALRYARDAARSGFEASTSLMAGILGHYYAKVVKAVVDNREEYKEAPVLCDGHEPNAVKVSVAGFGAEPIYIEDFSCYEGLGKPINCDRINIVSTKGMKFLSMMTAHTVVGYVDANGMSKELVNNSVMSTISGYHYLPGTCIVCGFDKDYEPLEPDEAYALANYLNGFDVYYDGKMFETFENVM